MTEEEISQSARFRLLVMSATMCVVGAVLSVYLVWWLMELIGWEFGYADGAEPLLAISLSLISLITLPISVSGKEIVAINIRDFRRMAWVSAAIVLILLLIFSIKSGIHLFGPRFWVGATAIVILPASCAAHFGYLPIYIHRRRKVSVS